jgi:hypothetical protein
MFQFVHPMSKIAKASFDSLPWWQFLDPGQPSRYVVVTPRERFNRHELISSKMEYALNDYDFEGFSKEKKQDAAYEMARSDEIGAERLYGL